MSITGPALPPSTTLARHEPPTGQRVAGGGRAEHASALGSTSIAAGLDGRLVALGTSLWMLYQAPGGCVSAAYWALGRV
jgi:hypothetical protein